ncbi:MAG: KTSC domain-containing protein [Chitinophagales bacterium]|nr:KTSC domain-containing protein [Chitinophagales bacterium]
MKLPDKYGIRLNTENHRKVSSQAVSSIDYSVKEKIIEIKFKEEARIFHYLNVKRNEWNKMMGLAEKKKGLGVYINQVFKKPYNDDYRDYYELIGISEPVDI